MSKRGKRGVTSFQKNYKEEEYKVDFDKNNHQVGAMSSPFMSWFGLKVRQTFPYHIIILIRRILKETGGKNYG
ncbi:hypothetical protein HanPSC8_Chr17g0775831 [Helianthus annuus]|nr:hypothetical protein HanLR1_Chr00c1237g0797891 [Helianthus annuus]KAJ0813638.1 hypothetical protein HanPSC8_Chr17g0775831 [Helianthus annuus]